MTCVPQKLDGIIVNQTRLETCDLDQYHQRKHASRYTV